MPNPIEKPKPNINSFPQSNNNQDSHITRNFSTPQISYQIKQNFSDEAGAEAFELSRHEKSADHLLFEVKTDHISQMTHGKYLTSPFSASTSNIYLDTLNNDLYQDIVQNQATSPSSGEQTDELSLLDFQSELEPQFYNGGRAYTDYSASSNLAMISEKKDDQSVKLPTFGEIKEDSNEPYLDNSTSKPIYQVVGKPDNYYVEYETNQSNQIYGHISCGTNNSYISYQKEATEESEYESELERKTNECTRKLQEKLLGKQDIQNTSIDFDTHSDLGHTTSIETCPEIKLCLSGPSQAKFKLTNATQKALENQVNDRYNKRINEDRYLTRSLNTEEAQAERYWNLSKSIQSSVSNVKDIKNQRVAWNKMHATPVDKRSLSNEKKNTKPKGEDLNETLEKATARYLSKFLSRTSYTNPTNQTEKSETSFKSNENSKDYRFMSLQLPIRKLDTPKEKIDIKKLSYTPYKPYKEILKEKIVQNQRNNVTKELHCESFVAINKILSERRPESQAKSQASNADQKRRMSQGEMQFSKVASKNQVGRNNVRNTIEQRIKALLPEKSGTFSPHQSSCMATNSYPKKSSISKVSLNTSFEYKKTGSKPKSPSKY